MRTAAEPRPGAADERRVRWQELTRSECFELLANEHLGRLAVIDDRGPVVWQRVTLAASVRGRSREQALAVMLDRYLSCAATSQPVHTWPAGA